MSTAYPIRIWFLRIEPLVDESAALEAWSAMVRAQGWSPVGDPELSPDPHANPGVIGRVVQYPGLTVAPNVTSAILVP